MLPLIPFPTHLELQTTSYCGAKCTFCPHSTLTPKGLMEAPLFYRMIDECAEHQVTQISPYFNAEPLTDKRLFTFVEYIRRRCPVVAIELSTTAQLLAPEVVNRLFESPITELRISSMGIRAQDYARLMPGIDYETAMYNLRYLVSAYQKRRNTSQVVQIVTLDGILDAEGEVANTGFWAAAGIPIRRWGVTSRAGNIASPRSVRHQRELGGCRSGRNTHWMSVLCDGSAVLCCMDWRREVVLGNASRQSLRAIWHGDAYGAMREQTLGGCAPSADYLCRRCEWAIESSGV